MCIRDRDLTVLTPHEGEFVRAGGDLSPGRERAAADFAREHGVYLVLKGPGTIAAAPDGRCMRNPTGNCGMAKGGSGDVLAGMLVSLLGLGLPPMDACCAAVWLHGRAGDPVSYTHLITTSFDGAINQLDKDLERRIKEYLAIQG